MKKPFFLIALLCLTLPSCKITADSVVGTYQQKEGTAARLMIKKDKTFEFIGPVIITAAGYSYSPSDQNVLAAGSWEIKNKQLLLNSFTTDSLGYENGTTDSIARFTSVTSFNFWNRYGDPVSIRSIRLPGSKAKPHFGNGLYLFAQDFKSTDTVRFCFEGYPDFTYPGSVPYAMGNNTHKITLREPYRSSVFNQTMFTCKKNKLLALKNNLAFTKKK